MIESKAHNQEPWQEPLMLDLSDSSDSSYAEKLFDNNKVNSVVDKIGHIAIDLYKMRSLEGDLNVSEDGYVDEINGQGVGFGKWFYFPWDKSLTRYPDLEDHRDLRTFRNKVLITREEQKSLYEARIAVFGLSVGSSVVNSLVMSGIGGTLILGDFDVLELTNTNRIPENIESVGSEKIDVVAKKISKIDPYINQVHLRNGFNGTDFEDQNIEYDIMFDEVDDIKSKFEMRDLSMRLKKPIVMVTDADGRIIVDVERYDTQPNTKLFLGKIKEESLKEIIEGSMSDSDKKRMLARFIGFTNISARLIKSATLVGKEVRGLPQLFITANAGGSLGAFTAREIILGRNIKSGRYSSNFRSTLKTGSPDGVIKDISSFYTFLKNS